MKRFITGFLAVALICAMVVPAVAKEAVEILTKAGPVWVGRTLGTDENGYAMGKLLYSANKGRSWKATTGDEIFVPYLTQMHHTGRDYVATYSLFGDGVVSADGIRWFNMPARQWMHDSGSYSGSAMMHKEFQLLWTGTEYMLRQNLMDDVRMPDPVNGPRNHMVTLLDKNYSIIGTKTFDGAVTAIRYASGTYYATVNGVEQSFTRADWIPANRQDCKYYSGGSGPYPMHSRYVVRTGSEESGTSFIEVSTDGLSWDALPELMSAEQMRFEETGGALVYYPIYSGDVYYYNGGRDWTKAELGFSTVEGVASPAAKYTIRWTGSGYLMCQAVSDRGIMGQARSGVSPRNTIITLLNSDLQRVSEYDFGKAVTGVAAVSEGQMVYYAQVQVSEEKTEIHRSEDGVVWSKTDLVALPVEENEWSGDIKAHRDGDVPVGSALCRLDSGVLYYSADGVHFAAVEKSDAAGIQVSAGAGGAVVCYIDALGHPTGKGVTLDYAQWQAQWQMGMPTPRTYLTVDGRYVSAYDLPPYQIKGCTMASMAQVAEAMGLTFAYDAATKTATCIGEGTEIKVKLGSTTATVNGVTKTFLAVPSELTDGQFCVPVRFMAESVGLDVMWDGASYTIHMSTPVA